MGKMGKKQVLCILLGIILAVAGYLVEKRDGALEDGNRLNRYAYGEGERQQEVWVRGLCEKEIPVEISLGEREYAEEDAKKALLEAGGKLADLIRGNNLSLQEVREDLHLVGWLEEEGMALLEQGCGWCAAARTVGGKGTTPALPDPSIWGAGFTWTFP